MARQVTLQNLESCAEHLRRAYKPLEEAADYMNMADVDLCPDFRIAPIIETRHALWKQLGNLDVEIGWIEDEIDKRRKE